MTNEMKIKLFEKVLELEHKIRIFDNEKYFEQLNGAWAMIEILGLGSEYIKWAIGK